MGCGQDRSRQHLQQIEKLEKQLFAKSDGWRGNVFTQELSKRNTFLLYALSAAGRARNDDTDGKVHGTAKASRRHQQPCQQQPAQKRSTNDSPPLPQQQQAVLGYIIVQVNSMTAHVNKLAVVPQARRRGLGAALLRAALQVALHERRVLCSTLHVDASNEPAIALYCKAGFKKDGVISDYYGLGKPALKLLASLQDSPAVAAFVSTDVADAAA
ncbi:hypothetical protein OEZ85_011648 [Tetradesmus obliquus]|uniref:N-acetyltransferase domain-containing protein n=1 Tax=Tetradesmus obliquus TaxID=3088 RepID=A0ABY8TVQ0_TETOB|nr:hypothetical protein OEZ85_011648 [Tetradesmus obliquus]